MYSRFSSRLKGFLYRLIGRSIDCCSLNQRTQGDKHRVNAINKAAPGCACEKFRMSKYSPCPVADSETLSRFVFSPLHVRKNGKLKPSIFSHVHERGCSIQRDSVAETSEIATFIKKFLTKNTRYSWIGVLYGQCRAVRHVKINGVDDRAVCVYDTAESGNPAHGELCQAYSMDEADKVELRRKLLFAFGDGIVIQPAQYRNGAVRNQLPQG